MERRRMISHGRTVTELEQAAWDEYELAVDQVPNGRMYDRVSVHNAFPDVKAAFDKAVEKMKMINTYNRLMKE